MFAQFGATLLGGNGEGAGNPGGGIWGICGVIGGAAGSVACGTLGDCEGHSVEQEPPEQTARQVSARRGAADAAMAITTTMATATRGMTTSPYDGKKWYFNPHKLQSYFLLL